MAAKLKEYTNESHGYDNSDKIKVTDVHEFLDTAKKQYERAERAESEQRDEALTSKRFAYGLDQWPDDIRSAREQQRRPVLTINKLIKNIKQVTGEQKINRMSVKIRPVDDKGDPIIAEIMSDIIRNIEEQSNAYQAHDCAFEQAVASCYGYFRVVAEYNDSGFDQDIKIKRITNQFSVYADPDCETLTREDAKFYFISDWISRKAFMEQYPNATLSEWGNQSQGEQYEKWYSEDSARVMEYYYKKPVKKTIVQVDTGEIFELTEDVPRETLEEQGYIIVKEREVDSHIVCWAKITGHEILEGPFEVACKYIPIVFVPGDEVNIEGKTKFFSLISHAMDAQRMYNYWRTRETEIIALRKKAPYFATAEQIEGHENEWNSMGISNKPYILYNHDERFPGPPTTGDPQTVPMAEINSANEAQADIQDTIGMYEASFGKVSNERSGKAQQVRKRTSDIGTYGFIDNLASAIKFEGRILADMIPRIYDNERVMRLRGEDGQDRLVEINKQVYSEKDGVFILINDLSMGEYDVVVDTGPMFSTRRQEAVQDLMQAMQYAPLAAPAIIGNVVEKMDIEGGKELSAKIDAFVGMTQQQQGAPPQQQQLPLAPPASRG
jgi:hypothetical protein